MIQDTNIITWKKGLSGLIQPIPYHPWDDCILTYMNGEIIMINLGQYTMTMDAMGILPSYMGGFITGPRILEPQSWEFFGIVPTLSPGPIKFWVCFFKEMLNLWGPFAVLPSFDSPNGSPEFRSLNYGGPQSHFLTTCPWQYFGVFGPLGSDHTNLV